MLTCYCSSCDLLHKDRSVEVPFPSVCAVEMIDSLAENFKMRFNGFCSHATNIHIFENLFSVEVNDAPEKLKLKLIELQYDSILHSSFNEKALIAFMLLYQYLGSLSYVS
jgi:hypothetical protein